MAEEEFLVIRAGTLAVVIRIEGHHQCFVEHKGNLEPVDIEPKVSSTLMVRRDPIEKSTPTSDKRLREYAKSKRAKLIRDPYTGEIDRVRSIRFGKHRTGVWLITDSFKVFRRVKEVKSWPTKPTSKQRHTPTAKVK